MLERSARALLLCLFVLGALAAVGGIGDDWARLTLPPHLPPGSAAAWLGSNALGQDLGARWLQALGGLWTTILPAAVAALGLALVLGWLAAGRTLPGIIARGTIDLADALPALLVALALLLAWRAGPAGVLLALAWCLWPDSVRTFEAEFRRLRAAPLWASTQLLGASPWRVLTRHALPLLLPLLRDQLVVLLILAIKLEAALGFIGAHQARTVSLGSLLAEGQAAAAAGDWWPLLLPCFTLLLLAGGMILTRPPRFLP